MTEKKQLALRMFCFWAILFLLPVSFLVLTTFIDIAFYFIYFVFIFPICFFFFYKKNKSLKAVNISLLVFFYLCLLAYVISMFFSGKTNFIPFG
jgi:hypothetical protein